MIVLDYNGEEIKRLSVQNRLQRSVKSLSITQNGDYVCAILHKG